MKTAFKLSLVAPLLLMACGGLPIEPAVSSFNEASVGIQLNGNAMELSSQDARSNAIASADALASDICRRGPNRRAEYVSSRNIPINQYAYSIERLYLCLSDS